MENKTRASAKEAWKGAQSQQFIIERVTPFYEYSKAFVGRLASATASFAYAYYAIILIEGSFLAIPASVELQFALGVTQNWLIAPLALLTAIIVIILLDALAIKSAPLLENSKLEDYLLGMAQLHQSGNGPKLAFPEYGNNRYQALMALSMATLLLLVLSYQRSYVFAGHQPMSAESWWVYLLMGIGTLVLFLLAMLFAPSHLIWKHYRGLKRRYYSSTRRRDKHLRSFTRLMSSLEDGGAVKASFIPDTPLSDQERFCLECQRALEADDGNYECLVPLQEQHIQVFALGEPAVNVQVSGVAANGKMEAGCTDAKGRLCLRYRAFEPKLKLLVIGNQLIQNLKTSSEPIRIELFSEKKINVQQLN